MNAVGSVGAQQRWCFVDGCVFQPTNIFWLTAPLGQLHITLTCPDAGKKVAAKGELSDANTMDANTMGQIAAAKEKEVHLTSLQDISCKEIKCTSFTSRRRRRARCVNVVRRFGTAASRHLSGPRRGRRLRPRLGTRGVKSVELQQIFSESCLLGE